jgi:hypothetical protein
MLTLNALVKSSIGGAQCASLSSLRVGFRSVGRPSLEALTPRTPLFSKTLMKPCSFLMCSARERFFGGHVALEGDDGTVYALFCGLFEGFFAAADDVDCFRSVFIEGFGNGEAEATSTSCNDGDDALNSKEIVDIKVGGRHFELLY